MTRKFWVVAAVSGAFVAGGFIGWIVTAISCQPDTCVAAATGIGLVSGVVTALGVGVVVVLAIRSLGEWREATAAGVEPPGPGCETGDQ
jgi:hypothetical protein